jgi:aryl-alcohol dehydrogenase-like predicted oxidoreductase
MEIAVLSFGSGSFFQKLPDGQWEPLVQKALDLGINYFDTSASYNFDKKNSHSETRLGQLLPSRRKTVHVCTKLEERDPEKAKQELENSLKRLRMDYVDVLMAHSILETEIDISGLEKGIYAQLRKWKEAGVAKHIGFSSMMTNGPRVKQLIEALDPEVVLLAMNATKYGNVAEHALSAAQARKTGVIAMKALRDVVGKGATANELLRYSFHKAGVASLCVAHSKIDELEQNAKTLSEPSQQAGACNGEALERRLAHLASPETLTWARPGYRDSGNIRCIV